MESLSFFFFFHGKSFVYEGQFCIVWFFSPIFWMHHFTLSWLVVYAEKSASCLMEAPLVYGVLFSFSFKILSLPLTRQFKKEMATHSSTFAWKIPWMGGPGRLQSMGSWRVRHDWSDLAAAAGAAWQFNYNISWGSPFQVQLILGFCGSHRSLSIFLSPCFGSFQPLYRLSAPFSFCSPFRTCNKLFLLLVSLNCFRFSSFFFIFVYFFLWLGNFKQSAEFMDSFFCLVEFVSCCSRA